MESAGPIVEFSVKKYFNVTYLKRSLLVIPVISSFLWGFYPPVRTDYYSVVSMCAVTAYSCLINFPFLSNIMHRKPVYYEDLVDEEAHLSQMPSCKESYQKIFIKFINIPLSISVALLAGYFIYKVKNSALSPFEIIGVVGGNISIYGNFQKKVGQMLIDFLNWKKKKNQLERRNSLEDKV